MKKTLFLLFFVIPSVIVAQRIRVVRDKIFSSGWLIENCKDEEFLMSDKNLLWKDVLDCVNKYCKEKFKNDYYEDEAMFVYDISKKGDYSIVLIKCCPFKTYPACKFGSLCIILKKTRTSYTFFKEIAAILALTFFYPKQSLGTTVFSAKKIFSCLFYSKSSKKYFF
jgi:hypothetical protein